ncbi:MAG: autotransporter outer membrane beta-barrel domain-containing protein, partial [Succinivibrio sp.]|nr:autotransporter outer membrane beta-barrel domain-containing protein [Succinivibrio sp.]
GTLQRSGNDGLVSLTYNDETASAWLEKTDDSIADPIKAYAAQTTGVGNQFTANSFVNKALNLTDADEVGKSLNSAARIAVLGGATQNTQLAHRAYTDALEERNGFIAKTSSSIGQVSGQDVTVWVTPLYATQDSDGYDGGKSGDLGVDGKLWGVTLGVDGALENGLTIGAAFHVGSGDSDSNGSGYASTDGDFDFWGLSFYGAYSFDGFKVLGDISYTSVDNDIDQDNAAGHLDTSIDSSLLSVGVQGKYDIDLDGITVTPHIGLRYHHLDVDSYTVRVQGGESISGKSFDANYVTIPVGVGISKDILTSGGWTVKPAADFSIIPVAGDKDVKTKIVSNDITMSAESDITDDVLFRLRLGVDAQYRNFGLGFGYGYLGGSDTKSHNLSATLRYTF